MKIKDSTGQWIEIPGLQGPQGLQGLQGPQGVSISSIEKTSANGLVDTYTITLSNGNTDTFTVTNGSPGQAGQPGQDGLTTSITLNGGSYNVDGSGDIALPALIPTSQIKDNLTSTSGVLNANQGRVLKGQVDGKFPLYTQMISNAPDFAYITSLPPGSYGWIQTGRLAWEPEDVPGGGLRCNLSIEAHSTLAQWVCHLNLIDGSTNCKEYIGEWNSGRDYIRWAEIITSKQKGVANGVATLGSDGKLVVAQRPDVGANAYYAVCTTAAATAAKTVTVSGFTLRAGARVAVTFNNVVPANATLNVSGTGAKAIRLVGANILANTIKAGTVVDLVYSGAYWLVLATDSSVYKPPVLSESTWAQIAEASEAGTASEYWSVGDEKDITIGGETITLVILGFNHDTKASGGAAGITFGMKNLLATTRAMNSSNTSSGGFTGSAMYTWLQGTLLTSLPTGLKNVLQSVNKKTSAGSQSSTINTNAMKIFLFSEIEIFGTVDYSKAGEGTQYPYFATAGARIKKLSNGSGAASSWWERSPHASNTARFCCVGGSGSTDYLSASLTGGVCFGFCV